MFKQAVANSPAKSCDIVIANAGVSGPDDVYAMEGKVIQRQVTNQKIESKMG